MWSIANNRMLEDRRALPKRTVNKSENTKAMHEENFLRDDIER